MRTNRIIPLPPAWRKVALLAHLVSIAAWIGIDASKAVLIFTTMADPALAPFTYRALALVARWPFLIAASAALITGTILTLASRFGLVRYWWVVIKLVINCALILLICFALWPVLTSLDAAAATGSLTEGSGSDLIYPACVAPSALLLASILSVFKPWGRIRRRGSAEGSRPLAGVRTPANG